MKGFRIEIIEDIPRKPRGGRPTMKKTMHKVAAKLKDLAARGYRSVKVFYTREVNGKQVPNYKRIAITGALVTAAGAGIYYIRKHKKHGYVLHKKQAAPMGPM